jgi:glutamine amidotransferase
MNIGIINYGLGNLGSISKVFDVLNCKSSIVSNKEEFDLCSHLILPGVGAFSEAMLNIRKYNFDKYLIEAKQKNVPILGICLGMQLLADVGYEFEKSKGLSFIQGSVEKMVPKFENIKIPHIGWNEIIIKNKSPILENIPNQSDFYFVHSYHFKTKESVNDIAITKHGDDYVSVIQKDMVFGVQFHPEKSSSYGLRLLQNFCNLKTC